MIQSSILFIITAIYSLILLVFIFMLIRDLVRGKVESLVAGLYFPNRKKYEKNMDKHEVISFSKNKDPRQYWFGIGLRAFFVIFTLFVGYQLYLRFF